jgi:hypothetical protein
MKSSVMLRSKRGASVKNDIVGISTDLGYEQEQIRRLANPEYQKEQEKHWPEHSEQTQRRDEQRRRETFHSLLIFIFVPGLPVWLWLAMLLLNHFTSFGAAAGG